MDFTGSSDDALSVLLFLLREHPRQCTFVLRDALVTQTLDSWFAVALVWMDNELHFPGRVRTETDFLWEIKICEEQFVVMPLILVDRLKRNLHANFLIIDRREGTFEHFEPYGFMPRIYGTPEPLRHRLRKLCSRTFPTTLPRGVVLEPRPSEGKGLQARQELERKMARPNQPAGFCLAWSALYAAVRLASPLERAEVMPSRMLDIVVRSTDDSLTDFIDRFASCMIERESSKSLAAGTLPSCLTVAVSKVSTLSRMM